MATNPKRSARQITADLQRAVADRIIELLERHERLDYRQPWIPLAGDGKPCRNITTARPYRGLNRVLLSFEASLRDYPVNAWLTFKQAKARGGRIKRGEKSEPIFFYKPVVYDATGRFVPPARWENLSESQRQSGNYRVVPMLKCYRVFNVFQTEGLPEEWYAYEARDPLPPVERHQRAEELLRDTGANLEIRSAAQAYYNPQRDQIVLPLREQFPAGVEAFYHVALHELCHWTGHPDRLNRELNGRRTSVAYAREELYAELGAAFLCAELGYEKPITDAAGYLQAWIETLREEPRYLFTAFKQAQRAADYVLTVAGRTSETESAAASPPTG